MGPTLTPARRRALVVVATRGPARFGMGMYDDEGPAVVSPAGGEWLIGMGLAARVKGNGTIKITAKGKKAFVELPAEEPAVEVEKRSLLPEIDTHRPAPVGECTVEEARLLTDRIRDAAEALWSLLADAHDRQAWRVLGYDSFKAYVAAEFGMSRGHAYRLLDQARVIAAIDEAAGVSPMGDTYGVTEREARELKPHLDELAANVGDATRDTDPELKAEAAREAVEQTRETIKQRKADDEEREPQPRIRKPNLGAGELSHPARYGDALLPVFAELLHLYSPGSHVLDPFAGTGRIHELADAGWDTVGIELEPEWAALHRDTLVGDATDLDLPDATFDAVVTSPTYGNRMADSYESKDPENRRSYRFDLGRPLTEGNSGAMQWGAEYRQLHERAWDEVHRVLQPGGVLILNVKDHERNGQRQHVAGWHVTTLCRLGFTLLEHREVDTGNLRSGANAEARFPEQVYALERDS